MTVKDICDQIRQAAPAQNAMLPRESDAAALRISQ